MIESQGEGIVSGKRSAKADPAEKSKLFPPLQQQPDQLEKIFVPPNCNAVFGHAAKPARHALIQILGNFIGVADSTEWNMLSLLVHSGDLRRQWLDLEAIDTDYRMTVVH